MKKRALLIAEKPSLMRAIRDAVNIHGFDDHIVYKSFAGHTMSLKMPGDYQKSWEQMTTTIKDLPMIPEPFEYTPTDDKKKMYKELKEECLSGKYDYVINACDAGREGQHIFWSFYDEIGAPLPVKRLWSSDTTTDSLGAAMKSLRSSTEPRLRNMTDASKLRAQFDWLIGMNASRAFSEKARAGVAVGRVMTPTLKLVVDRELEILNFKAKTFYEVLGEFEGYTGKYTESENKGRFNDKKSAEAFIKSLSGKGEVVGVTRKKVTTKAPELFSLQTLQSEAGKKYGYTMKETLGIIQGLYDDGFLSYPRTDSSYVTKNTAATFPQLLKTVTEHGELSKVADDILKDVGSIKRIQTDGKYVDDRKVEDHDAILPTKKAPNRTLNDAEKKIYDMVARRFLAIFLPPLITEKARILTRVDKADFISNGSVLVQKGFSELYDYNPKDQILPSVNKGDKQTLKSTKLLEGKTTPPKRYTSSTLGDAMAAAGRFTEDKAMKEILKEAKGIGTTATRGDMVEKLVMRKWMEYKGKAKTIYATKSGISVIEALDGHDLLSVDLTAEWEDKLREIEKGKMPASAFEAQMKDYIHKTIRDIETMTLTVISAKKGDVGSSIGKCPICGKDVIVGKTVYFCEGYNPKDKASGCAFVVGKKVGGASLSKTEMVKLLDGKKTKELSFLSKEKKKYKAKLFWNKGTQKLDREFSSGGSVPAKATTKKTKAGNSITEDKFTWKEEGTDKRIYKEIWKHKVSLTEAQKLFDGETVGPHKFVWSSGKTGNAKLYFDNKKNKTAFSFK